MQLNYLIILNELLDKSDTDSFMNKHLSDLFAKSTPLMDEFKRVVADSNFL
jgi:hypothetical protein